MNLTAALLLLVATMTIASQSRGRARDLGITPGTMAPGPLNAITDVAGVRVGHTTLIQGQGVRTGVTAIVPHAGNVFRDKVAGAVFVGNAFGKLAGSTQVDELGTIESPIVLTNTLSVGTAVEGVVRWTLSQPGNENVRSVNALVGETNDGGLNDIRGLHVTRDHVIAAITSAKGGAVQEGAVGAGTGTVAFGWKGGIGTSSRRVRQGTETYTLGVLVQTNYGGKLVIDGVPVWKNLTPRPPAGDNVPAAPGTSHVAPDPSHVAPGTSNVARGTSHVAPRTSDVARSTSHVAPGTSYVATGTSDVAPRTSNVARSTSHVTDVGSCMIVVATDAPIDARDLKRLAARAIYAMARTGSTFSNGSGDFAIAFSTHPSLRMSGGNTPQVRMALPTDAVSGLFEAALDATEEAIYNSLFQAVDISGGGRTIRALPLDEVRGLLKKYGR